MAVLHREDSIVGIKKKVAEKQKGFMAVGKQLAKLTVDVAGKDKVIETLGKQFTSTMLENAKIKRELAEIKAQIAKGDK